jgi:hypothetical protein
MVQVAGRGINASQGGASPVIEAVEPAIGASMLAFAVVQFSRPE